MVNAHQTQQEIISLRSKVNLLNLRVQELEHQVGKLMSLERDVQRLKNPGFMERELMHLS